MDNRNLNNPIALCRSSDRADACAFKDCPLYEKCYPEETRALLERRNKGRGK